MQGPGVEGDGPCGRGSQQVVVLPQKHQTLRGPCCHLPFLYQDTSLQASLHQILHHGTAPHVAADTDVHPETHWHEFCCRNLPQHAESCCIIADLFSTKGKLSLTMSFSSITLDSKVFLFLSFSVFHLPEQRVGMQLCASMSVQCTKCTMMAAECL